MAEYITNKQTNQGWNLSWSALDRYPMIAKRRFATLADAQAFVDDVAPGASATEGLILAVIKDSVAKNNGVYYVQSVANNDPEYGAILAKGTLIKVGGTETETATNYSEAKELSKTLVVGQLIKVAEAQEIEETVEGSVVKNTYQAGFYIVEGAGVISALATSTGSDDEVGALKTRVASLETGKVDKVEGSRLMTDAEGTKLKGIAEGAEVNYVKSVQGPLAVDTDGMLTVDLSSKVDKNDYTSAMTAVNNAIASKTDYSAFTEHVQDTVAHITANERLTWNAAEQNAKDYAKGLVMDGETPRFDTAGAAATAEQNAKDYTDAEIEKLAEVYDEIGAAATAEQNAKDYANSLVTDEEGKSRFDAAGAAATAEQNAKDYTDAEIEKLAEVYDEIGAAATAKSEAIAEAKAYTDGIVNDTTAEDGSVVKGLNSRISDLEAIDHEKLASDASAAAVATVLDGAPEKFDTLKEVAQWIADSESAATAADLVTRVSALEAIDHDAYKAADTALETSLKGYVDGKDTAMDTRVKVLEAIDHDAYKAADETLKGELEGKINLKADASALTAEVGAREALAALVGTRAEGDSEDVFTKLANLVAKDGEIDGVLATKADASALTAETSAREALAALVGTRAEGDSEDVFTKLANLADGKLTKDAKVNGVSFDENGEAVINAGDIALDEAILSDDGKGGKTEQYPVSSSIQAVLQSLNNRITAAVSGGLTSVAAGSGIAVTDVIGNSQTVSIKVSETANNAVKLNTDGIYVEQIMVSGNDIEEIAE